MTGFANFLNTTFYSFDYALFNFWQGLASPFMTGLTKFISFFGYKGIMMLVLSTILLLFKKTRRCGVYALIAIGIGALITNVTLKKVVARIRPYEQNEVYNIWWQKAVGVRESDLSFPSGHMTVTSATMTGIFFGLKRKGLGSLLIIPIILMAIARNYLIVHYATDIIAGALVGILAGTLSFIALKFAFSALEKHSENKVCNFLLNADLFNLFRKNKN